MQRLIADHGCDADSQPTALRQQDAALVILGHRNRKRPVQYDLRRYRDRWRVGAMFCRLKDFRGVATQYDKLARDYLGVASRQVVHGLKLWKMVFVKKPVLENQAVNIHKNAKTTLPTQIQPPSPAHRAQSKATHLQDT